LDFLPASTSSLRKAKSCERAWNESIITIADAHSDDFGKKVRSVLFAVQSNR
jgi:hypothetical protein